MTAGNGAMPFAPFVASDRSVRSKARSPDRSVRTLLVAMPLLLVAMPFAFFSHIKSHSSIGLWLWEGTDGLVILQNNNLFDIDNVRCDNTLQGFQDYLDTVQVQVWSPMQLEAIRITSEAFDTGLQAID